MFCLLNGAIGLQKFLDWMIVIFTNLCNIFQTQNIKMYIQLLSNESIFTFFLIWYHYPSAEHLKSSQFYFVILGGMWEPARGCIRQN